jgi:hypothetical protein
VPNPRSQESNEVYFIGTVMLCGFHHLLFETSLSKYRNLLGVIPHTKTREIAHVTACPQTVLEVQPNIVLTSILWTLVCGCS